MNGLAEFRSGHFAVPSPSAPRTEIDALLVDRDGALWTAFDRFSIGRYSHGDWQTYRASKGLPSDRCTRAMFEDREGSLWFGLLDAGVVQLRNGAFAVFGKREGLSGNYVGNVLQAQDGTIWIGADSSGLNHLLPDGRVEVWDRRRGVLARLQGSQVHIYRDPQESDSSLNALYEDREGRLWVGFFGKGLARLDGGVFRHVNLSWRVSDIAQAPDGALWVATDGDGVQRVAGDAVKRFTTANGLPSDHAMCVYADSDSSVWVGTASGGLSRIRNEQIVSWRMKQGLPASTIGSIIEDNFGNFWMGTDNGIFRIAKTELNDSAGKVHAALHPILYGTANGLRSRETLYGSVPAVWKTHEGRLWFATIQGAAG